MLLLLLSTLLLKLLRSLLPGLDQAEESEVEADSGTWSSGSEAQGLGSSEPDHTTVSALCNDPSGSRNLPPGSNWSSQSCGVSKAMSKSRAKERC